MGKIELEVESTKAMAKAASELKVEVEPLEWLCTASHADSARHWMARGGADVSGRVGLLTCGDDGSLYSW